MPYKDPERQRAAVRRHNTARRVGTDADPVRLLQAEVNSLKIRLKRAHAAGSDARRREGACQGTGLSGKAEIKAIKRRLGLVIGNLEDGGRSAFQGLAIDAAIEDLRRLVSDIELGTVEERPETPKNRFAAY